MTTSCYSLVLSILQSNQSYSIEEWENHNFKTRFVGDIIIKLLHRFCRRLSPRLIAIWIPVRIINHHPTRQNYNQPSPITNCLRCKQWDEIVEGRERKTKFRVGGVLLSVMMIPVLDKSPLSRIISR